MKRILGTSFLVSLMALSAGLLVAPNAEATGCATMTRTYSSGSSKYAVVKNTCGRRIDAQVVVNNWPDTNCLSISANSTRTFRTGGILSPTASYAREC